MSRIDVSDYLPSLPVLDFLQPLFEKFTSTMIERVGIDVQRRDLKRRLECAWDSREDNIPEQ